MSLFTEDLYKSMMPPTPRGGVGGTVAHSVRTLLERDPLGSQRGHQPEDSGVDHAFGTLGRFPPAQRAPTAQCFQLVARAEDAVLQDRSTLVVQCFLEAVVAELDGELVSARFRFVWQRARVADVGRTVGGVAGERERFVEGGSRCRSAEELFHRLRHGVRARIHPFRSVAARESVDDLADEEAELQRGEHPEFFVDDGERRHRDAAATELGEAAAVVLEPTVVDEAEAPSDRRATGALQEGDEVAVYGHFLAVDDEPPGSFPAFGQFGKAEETSQDGGDPFGGGGSGCGISGHEVSSYTGSVSGMDGGK